MIPKHELAGQKLLQPVLEPRYAGLQLFCIREIVQLELGQVDGNGTLLLDYCPGIILEVLVRVLLVAVMQAGISFRLIPEIPEKAEAPTQQQCLSHSMLQLTELINKPYLFIYLSVFSSVSHLTFPSSCERNPSSDRMKRLGVGKGRSNNRRLFGQQLECGKNGNKSKIRKNMIIIMDKASDKLSISSLPKRNKSMSSTFRKVVLQSNYFKVDVSKLKCLCIFALKFVSEKAEEQHEDRARILEEIIPEIKEFIHDPIIKNGLIFSHKPPVRSDKTIKHGQYVILIREISRFDAQKNPQLLLYFLGNVMRKVMERLGYIEVATTRKFISMKSNTEIENVLVYSGFKARFELLLNGYYLSVDTTTKIVRNQSVLEYINYIYNTGEGLDRDQKREMVRKNLTGQTILTNYGKTRYMRIEDVLFIDLTQVVIESCGMLLPQYYKSRYDYQIKNLKQPLIYARNKTKFKTYLVPELCLMTGIPDHFDESRNKLVTDMSRVPTDTKKDQIEGFVQTMNKKQGNEIFQLLGVGISQKCEKIQGQLIPSPKIMLGQGKTIARGRESSFSLQDLPIYRMKQPTKLGILTFDDIDSNTMIEYFFKTFKALKMKIQITVIKIDAGTSKRGMETLKTYIQIAKDKENCNMCLVIIPNRFKYLYQKIKQATLLEKEIGCQVVLEGTLKKKNLLSVALKVLLQILAKAGHTLWRVASQYQRERIMYVGYYSTEVGKGKTNRYTVGICASSDDSHSEIFAKTRQYSKEHEELQSMKELLLEALVAYKKKYGFVPSDIIIIENKKSARSEESSISFFVQPLIKMMEEYYGLKRPKLIYLFIMKGLNQRFFRTFEGKPINPAIGTLISEHITPSSLDFYLIAHDITKKGGSLTPLRYKIAFSDSNLERETLYALIFAQCFNYPNYCGSIRHPGVLQSAVKCSKFGAEVLGDLQIPDKFKVYPYFL